MLLLYYDDEKRVEGRKDGKSSSFKELLKGKTAVEFDSK